MSRPDTGHALIADGARLGERIEVDHFRVEEGQCVVICGPNGSGKSSLLRLLAGLERETTGNVHLGSLDLLTAGRREIAAHLAWLPQRPQIDDSITCEAIVAAARFRFLEGTERALEQANRILEQQEIGYLAQRSARQVSGGELQRVLIASLIAQDTPFLLVDEPANHLDPRHQVAAYTKLGRLWQRQGRTVIVVTHDVRLAHLLGPADEVRVVGVKGGQLQGEINLASPRLADMLSELYSVSFVDPSLPGGLAVDFTATREPGKEP